MAWVESTSASFAARHDSVEAGDAQRVLHSLEHARAALEPWFGRLPAPMTVVLHQRPVALVLSNPLMPLAWWATDPSSRRYIAGWAGREELHVLSPSALRERAAPIPGSREMLLRTAACIYAGRVIAENNPELARVAGPIRFGRTVRWSWLVEGGARWFGGQTGRARAVIARRLRAGRRPSFPPGPRDAPLLGGTVIDLLVARHGEQAAARLCTRLHPQGPDAALTRAFGVHSLEQLEGDWRAHLAQLIEASH